VVVDLVGGVTRDRPWQTLRPGGRLVTLTGPRVETVSGGAVEITPFL
jgi:hypothetical protein